jgi:manganese/zinc/iron transport system substrate-binding protein
MSRMSLSVREVKSTLLPLLALLTTFGAAATAGACQRGDASTSRGRDHDTSGPIRVVTTVGMLADMAVEVGGDCVDVTALMGPGVDPHLYRASAGDVDKLRRAEVILYGGLNLEGRMADVLERLRRQATTLAVLESLPGARLLAHPTYAGHFDPHVWMDPGLWSETVPAVAEVLATRRPACREAIQARAADYGARLRALDGWVRETIATIPQATRALVTAHDAFHYFGRAYELDVIGIQGVSTEAEASLADLRAVADALARRRIPAVFVETSVNPRNLEAVRAAVRDRGWEVRIGGELFSDAMGASGTWQGTYVGMLRSNVLTIAQALGGQPAPWPEALREFAERWGLPS